ncbi:MAG: dTDP-4-dehydrorhamnose reductase [Calothrix sp. C42_A2020_038]|nr:dTDP-4-dehydrorhamnose reductase [Calothrix sp. C42_A2020_038]
MRILLTGSSGQVGWELQRSLAAFGEVVCAGRAASVNSEDNSLHLDLSAPETICSVIREVKPNLIVNPAAYTAVDKAETEPQLAMAVNGTAPGIIAEEAKRLGAVVIHYSTDYVFNGTQSTPYTEDDQPDPQNIYGRTKLAGEKAIQAVDVPHLILRTSWVYGLRGKNFLLTMLKLAREREELKVVNDQIGAPTWSRMIATVSADIVAQGQTDLVDFISSNSGIYHLTATGQTSWYEFAKAIFENDPNKNQQKLKHLLPIPSHEYPTPAKRPAYSTLDTSKISKKFSINLYNWQDALLSAFAESISVPLAFQR